MQRPFNWPCNMLNTVTLQKLYFPILFPVYKLLKKKKTLSIKKKKNLLYLTLILNILVLHDSLTTSEIFCWLPGHVGIEGKYFGRCCSKDCTYCSISPLLFHQCRFHIAILNMLLVLISNRYAKKNGIMKRIIT